MTTTDLPLPFHAFSVPSLERRRPMGKEVKPGNEAAVRVSDRVMVSVRVRDRVRVRGSATERSEER